MSVGEEKKAVNNNESVLTNRRRDTDAKQFNVST